MYKRILILLLLATLVACRGPQTTEQTAVETVEELVNSDNTTAVDETEAEPEPEPVALSQNLNDQCVTDYSEGVDYFPEKVEVNHSDGFSVDYFDHYKVVTVNSPYAGAEAAASYLLVQCGTPIPDGFDTAVVVEVPIDNFIAMSTTYLPHLSTLEVVDSLTALDSVAFANSPDVVAQIEAGEVAEIGSGPAIDVESVIEIDPDVVMTYSSGSAEFDSQPKLEEAGITVVVNSDYLDTDPVGQAEWVKFMAAFFNQEGEANEWFDAISAEYDQLVALTANVESKPTVFMNTPYEGTWYMAGGQSYVAKLLADAGADYLWADDESTGSLFLDFEQVYDQAQAADFWLNLGFVPSLADLEATDERFAEFAAFQNGNLYNNDARTNANGGNDYYESGATNPHLVLADLIKILHPELLPDHELVYYRLVE